MDIQQIWTEYRSGLKAFLHSRVSNPSDVEDLLQDILIKTHSKLDSLNAETSLRPWLYQIASHSIIDFYRRDKSKRPLMAEDLWYETIERDTLPELERCIEPFIDALPDDTARLLRAVELEGVTQKEQAALMGISYSTLKSRVQSGRRQLRQLFEDCCEFSLDARGNIIDYEQKNCGSGNC